LKIDSAVDQKVNFYSDCNREVAILCNHKKAESKGLKDQLEKIESAISEKQKELKEIEAIKKKIKAGKPSGSKLTTIEACDARAKKLRE
jgi:DNA topoisomerase-1